MKYSAKNFIKNNFCSLDASYDIKDLDLLATQISEDSKGEYTKGGAMKILCKYVRIVDGTIQFDPYSRNFDQSFDSIEQKLIETKKVVKPIKQKSEPLKEIKAIKEIKEVKKKGGFGNFGKIKHIIELDDDNSINEKPEKTESNKDKVAKQPTTKIFNKTTQGNESSNQEIVKKGGLGTVKKGGFGTFKKKEIMNDYDSGDFTHFTSNGLRRDREDMNEKNNKVFIIDQAYTYTYPIEIKYKGVIRTDPQYGPYGVDNYYDPNIKSDKLNALELKRVLIYRKLASLIYPAQRSVEWFIMRDKMITASDGGTIVKLNPYEHESGFIAKKVHGKPFDTNIDCYHGKKYEQVATMIYELRMNVMVKEFGLCQHPKYDFLGASPDGIVSEYKLKTKDGRTWQEIEKEADKEFNDLKKELDELKRKLDEKKEDIELKEEYIKTRDEYMKKRYEYLSQYGILTKYVGRMLEIKCPRTRKILMDPNAPEVYGPHGETIYELYKDVKKGVCPAYYWVQVQLQLQCCELDECDFWQCTITEYTDKDDFLADSDHIYPWLSRQTKREKGAVIQLIPRKQLNNRAMDYNKRIYNFAEFIHQPRLDMTPCELDHWISDTIQNISQTHNDKDGNTENDLIFERVLYWKLDNSRNITVLRDDKWFTDNLPIFKQAWDYVIYFRNNKEHSKLLKKYFDKLPKDKFNKLIEIIPGSVMETVHKLSNEPKEPQLKKEYQKFVQGLMKETANVPDQKPYDVVDDVNHIKKIMDHIIEETKKCTTTNMEDKNKMNELLEVIKLLKFDAESNIDQMDLLNF